VRIMVSKFPGVCRKCNASVQRGDTIGYHGRGYGISCGKCAGVAPARDPDAIVGACWECKAPEGKFRCYGAATPVYCDACEARIRPTTLDWKLRHPEARKSVRYVPDATDIAYEDACASACGPGL
jgi:hypothetical protein